MADRRVLRGRQTPKAEPEMKEETVETEEVNKKAISKRGKGRKAKKDDVALKAKEGKETGGEGASGTQEDEGSEDAEKSKNLKIPVSRGKKDRRQTAKDKKEDEDSSEKVAGEDAEPAKRVDEAGPSTRGRKKACKETDTTTVSAATGESLSRNFKKDIPQMYEDAGTEEKTVKKPVAKGKRARPKPVPKSDPETASGKQAGIQVIEKQAKRGRYQKKAAPAKIAKSTKVRKPKDTAPLLEGAGDSSRSEEY